MARQASSGRAWFRRWTLSGWLALALLLLASTPVLAQESGPRRAGLVVVHEDGRNVTRCVTLAEERITGMALLQQSGMAAVTNAGPSGSTLCKLDGEGCPETDCFCKCKGTPCFYWNYYHLSDGAWVYSGMGAAAWTLGDGDVDAWVWSDGNTPPPALTFADICPAEDAPAATTETTPAPDTAPVTDTAPATEPVSVTGAATTTAQYPATLTPTPVPATPLPRATAPATPHPPTATSAPTIPATATATPSPTTPPTATATAATTAPPAALQATPAASTLSLPLTASTRSTTASENRRNYMVFGILVLILGGGYFIVQRRRP